MNTRGIVQLVVLNIGVELNVISNTIFAMFVSMATILTFLTSPLLYLLYRKDLDPEKLSMDNIAEELNLVHEQNNGTKDSNVNIPERSNGELEINEEQRSYRKSDLNSSISRHGVIGNLFTLAPICPRRSINMTRF